MFWNKKYNWRILKKYKVKDNLFNICDENMLVKCNQFCCYKALFIKSNIFYAFILISIDLWVRSLSALFIMSLLIKMTK